MEASKDQKIQELELRVQYLERHLEHFRNIISEDTPSQEVVDQLIIEAYQKELLLNSVVALNRELLNDTWNQDLLKTIMAEAQSILECSASSVLLLNPEKTYLYFEVAHGDKAREVKTMTLDVKEGIAGKVAREGKSSIVNEPYQQPDFNSGFDRKTGFVTRAILCAPLIHQEEIFGVVQVINPIGRDNFTLKDLYTLEVFARQACVTLLKQRLTRELQNKNHQLEEANLLKSTFLANVSHELRTPLTPVLAWASMLQDDLQDVDMLREGLMVMEDQCNLLNELITSLIYLAQLDSKQVFLEIQAVNLQNLCEKVAKGFQKRAGEKNISITVESTECPQVEADPSKVKLCLKQLLDNAIKFNLPKGEIQLKVEEESDHVVCKITNTGELIPDDLIPKLTQRFRQVDNSLTRKHGGLGIGLSLVQGFLELFQGDFSIKSDPSTGTTTAQFRLRKIVR